MVFVPHVLQFSDMEYALHDGHFFNMNIIAHSLESVLLAFNMETYLAVL